MHISPAQAPRSARAGSSIGVVRDVEPARLSGMDVELLVVSERLLDSSIQRALSRDVQRGRRMRIRRGVYIEPSTWELLEPIERHLVAMRAFDAVAERRPVFSHWSAAVLLGLPTLARHDPARPHVIVDGVGGRGATGVYAHVLPLEGDEVTEHRGLLCTDPVRTVVDVAASALFEYGVAVADAVLHEDPALAPALLAAAEAARSRRGSARVAGVVAFADPASESPGESISRVTMARLGVPKPVLQQVFTDRSGFIARTDFWFPKERTAGEMDGKGKYVDPAMNGGDPGNVVYREKVREDRVRALDVRFARWGWVEARSTLLLGRKLAAAGVLPTR